MTAHRRPPTALRGIPDDSPRDSADLTGVWEFVTDPDTMGRDDGWYEADATWPGRTRTVSVPHSWQEHDELFEYTGTAWYRRRIDLSADQLDGRDAIIRFGAVDYEATVWVNGTEIGTNRGGYLPFEFDATDELTPGENLIAVEVTDPADLSEIPHGKQGEPWYTRVSGIWQPVGLALRPTTRVTDVNVTPDLATDTADVELAVEPGSVDLSTIDCVVEARLDSEVVTTTQMSLGDYPDGLPEAVLSFDDPAYWSPDEPTRYDLDVRLLAGETVIDRYTDTFGLRSFAVEDGAFRLNGEPFTMRGVLEQGYYPQTLYRPSSEDTFAHEVRVAKELGFNLIRKHVKPAHPEFLEEADRQGILVWEEPANPSRFTARSRNEVIDQLHALVDRDYNRPSVVIWSLYNEEWGIGHHDSEETLWTDEEKQRFLADLYHTIRERDTTRVVCDNSGWAHVATDVNDYHRYFISPDRAEGWVADLDHICRHSRDNYATAEFDDHDAPIVLSELGTWGLGDVTALREEYGGDPPWFHHDFLTDPVKRPGNFDDNLDSTDLRDVFGDLDAIKTAWQWREFASLKHILEETRKRPAIDGYVLTELSDIEWEFNGILDYFRNEKVFTDEFTAVNDEVVVVADPDSHVGWSGEDLPLTVTVVNDTGDELTGAIEWSLGDAVGSTPVTVPAHDVQEPTVSDLVFPPATGPVSTMDIEVAFVSEDLDVSAKLDRRDDRRISTTEPIHTADRADRMPPSATVYAEGAFASRLARAGIDITHGITDAVDVAFTDRITSEIDQFADQGGAVVHIPTRDGDMANGSPFTYHRIPEGESWIGATSLLYQDTGLLDGICDSSRLGWEFEGLYPYRAATDLDKSVDRVHVGYVEGWIANWSSPLVVRGYGSGSMTAFTFRVRDAYGDQPTATRLVDRLIDWLAE